ncbi:MAG: ABC transporter permease [Acetatifactor sp.]|nr:ABC transporter permease [Acetatifactor sp.]
MRLKPFSSLYFIRENKARCILLMFMIFLGFGDYLGGLYVTNPLDNWECYLQYFDEVVSVNPAMTHEDLSDFVAFTEELEENDQVTVLRLGETEGFQWFTIMGFESGFASLTFCSVEDFHTYCEYFGIQCDFESLGNGSLILSEKLARNRGLEIGDKVNRDTNEAVYGDYTVTAFTQEDGYLQYYINEEAADKSHLLILGKGISGKELYDLVYELRDRHPVSIYEIREQITGQLETFDKIYLFVILLLSVILAVTINAAFIGMYQRRNFEFAVYRAIGMGKGAIVRKLLGEFLWMDILALVLGGGVVFMGLYLFNNLVLYPDGKYLRYFHPTALTGLVVCNVMVILPLIVTRCRQLLRADICEY